MTDTGMVQEGSGGTTYVAHPLNLRRTDQRHCATGVGAVSVRCGGNRIEASWKRSRPEVELGRCRRLHGRIVLRRHCWRRARVDQRATVSRG